MERVMGRRGSTGRHLRRRELGVDRRGCTSEADARRDVFHWIAFHNHRRRHSAFGCHSPADCERTLESMSLQQIAAQPMFIDIYLASLAPDVDRDDIEDELQEVDGFDVVGAGVGEDFVNLDVEVDDTVPREWALATVAEILRNLGSHAGAYVRMSDTGERIEIGDIA
ncbi:hypothetical protein AB0K00_32995 [Dactylosporangium sp. NPDC049525]|uniref:hypothetical protein n=1 Tax=Dactylosporangium sp. NPDC049525 TaxID=3154730 RepID=UPI0034188658